MESGDRPPDADVVRSVLWRGDDPPGHERCDLVREADGWRLVGTVLAAWDGLPATVQYEVALDDGWITRATTIGVRLGTAAPRSLRLERDASGRWWADRDREQVRQPVPFADGLMDVDLGCTPATNTLPIRRLRPAVGETVEATAVWVRFPDLALEPLPQRYSRLDERRFRYESAGGFVAGIEVDDIGLVVAYEGLWQREGEAPPAP